MLHCLKIVNEKDVGDLVCQVALRSTMRGERIVDNDRPSSDMKRASRERARLQRLECLKFAKAREFVCSSNVGARVGRQCCRVETTRGLCAYFGANLLSQSFGLRFESPTHLSISHSSGEFRVYFVQDFRQQCTRRWCEGLCRTQMHRERATTPH